MNRSDVTAEAVVRLYFEGAPVAWIARHLGVSASTVGRRLAAGRELFPDLAWDERCPPVALSPVRTFVRMRDGVRGQDRVVAGSVVRGMRRYK